MITIKENFRKNFSVMAYSNGFTLWNLKINEEAILKAFLEDEEFFNCMLNIFNNGDMILVSSPNLRYSAMITIIIKDSKIEKMFMFNSGYEFKENKDD